MNTLADVGFVLVHETDRAILWSCPFGKFWRFKSGQVRAMPTLRNLEKIAKEVTKDINDGLVLVNLLKTTEGGGARVSFPVAVFSPYGDVLEEKRATKNVPLMWVERLGNKTAIFHTNLRKKMSGSWSPKVGGIVLLEEVLTWLIAANADAVRAINEKQAAEKKRAADAALAKHNADISRYLFMHIQKEYGPSLAAYSRTKMGEQAGLTAELVSGDPDHALRLALRSPSFRPWFAEWTLHIAAEAAKPHAIKPRRSPDEVISPCFVEWVEWRKKNGQMRRVDRKKDGCTARRFGKKWVIAMPTGEEIIKMAGPNLMIRPG